MLELACILFGTLLVAGALDWVMYRAGWLTSFDGDDTIPGFTPNNNPTPKEHTP